MHVFALPRAPASVRVPVRERAQRALVHISGPSLPDFICELVGIDAGILHVRCDIRVADQSPATLLFDHILLSGVVVGCQPIGAKWGISIALTMSRRREARMPANGTLTVGIVCDSGTTSYQATVTDISPFGLGLRIPCAIGLAARVYVETESEMIMGEIRHCRPTGDGEFVVGVMIVEVVPDSRTEGKLTVLWDRLRRKMAAGLLGADSTLG